jgi:hypothetical protein
MLIKNVSERPLTLSLDSREIELTGEGEVIVTAEEVRDPALQAHLQVRSVAVVRPSTDEEEEEAVALVKGGATSGDGR